MKTVVILCFIVVVTGESRLCRPVTKVGGLVGLELYNGPLLNCERPTTKPNTEMFGIGQTSRPTTESYPKKPDDQTRAPNYYTDKIHFPSEEPSVHITDTKGPEIAKSCNPGWIPDPIGSTKCVQDPRKVTGNGKGPETAKPPCTDPPGWMLDQKDSTKCIPDPRKLTGNGKGRCREGQVPDLNGTCREGF